MFVSSNSLSRLPSFVIFNFLLYYCSYCSCCLYYCFSAPFIIVNGTQLKEEKFGCLLDKAIRSCVFDGKLRCVIFFL
jgi:hypothetical protein